MPEPICGKGTPQQWSAPLYLTAELHLLPTCDYIRMQGYLVCSSCLQAMSASCGPFSVWAGGWSCQLCRDALGTSLPPRAHWAGAEPAALRTRCTLVGCHRHLQGCGSLSEAQTYKSEQGFSSCITRTDSPVNAINNRKERKGVGGVQWNQTLSVTQAQSHTKWTKTSCRAYSGTNSKQLNPCNSLPTLLYYNWTDASVPKSSFKFRSSVFS